MPHTFALLVPVKALSLAKSRLSVTAASDREPLMRAFALDAIAAASQSPAVSQVHVVTDDPGFEVDGALRLPDEGDGDLNRALHHASLRVRLADPDLAVAAMCADLPSLRTEDLTDALSAGLTPRWFVADAAGTGTTLLAAGPGVDLAAALRCRVGPSSRGVRCRAGQGRDRVLASRRGHRGGPGGGSGARARGPHGAGSRQRFAVTRCSGR